MSNYKENKYRDVQNMSLYPEACDIYSLGQLLKRLIILYHFYLEKDKKIIFQKYSENYKEEKNLINLMKSQIESRPKCIRVLRMTKEYNEWLNSIPKYIPFLF